jgi:tellurite resistance protein TerC
MEVLFPFAEYWHIYAGFLAFVLAMLALDLGVFHRDAHEVSFKEALTWSAIWITLALVFNYGFYLYVGEKFGDEQTAKRLGLEFLTGFLVEKSLAVDNIFVFVLVFNFFAIPLKYQHRVLFYGILGALFFRAIFIALGSVLMQYHAVVLFFGVLLIITGIKILVFPDKQPDLAKNPARSTAYGQATRPKLRSGRKREARLHAAVFGADVRRVLRHHLCSRFRAGDLCYHQ